MSTKRSTLPRVRKGLSIPDNLCPELCTSYVPGSVPRPPIHSIRPLCLATDLPVVYHWLESEYGCLPQYANKPLQQLEEAYASILDSDFAQPFMALVNNIPLCQIDIFKTAQDAVSLYYEARPGDFGLDLLTAPQATEDQISGLMSSCMDYFFSFPEVGRIIAYPEAGNASMSTLFKKTGFRWRKKFRMGPYKIADLYMCTREYAGISGRWSRRDQELK